MKGNLFLKSYLIGFLQVVAGLSLGFLASFLSPTTSKIQEWIWFASIFVAFAVIFPMLALMIESARKLELRIGELLHKSGQSVATIWRDQGSSDRSGSTTTAFDFCSDCAKKAKERIYVISPYFPSFNSAGGVNAAKHTQYLEEGMLTALRLHVEAGGNRPIEYRRIIQLDNEGFEDIDRRGVINESFIGELGLSEHISDVLALEGQNASKINVTVQAIKYQASLPSVLIIDSRYVFFSLPSRINNPSTRSEFDFVLEIEDRSENRDITAEFVALFLSFAHRSKEITRINKHQTEND